MLLYTVPAAGAVFCHTGPGRLNDFGLSNPRTIEQSPHVGFGVSAGQCVRKTGLTVRSVLLIHHMPKLVLACDNCFYFEFVVNFLLKLITET